jgi:hypothetical protein
MTVARMTYFLLACKILAEKTAASRGCSAAANGANKKTPRRMRGAFSLI